MNKRKWLIGGLLLLVVGVLVWFNLSKAGITTARVPKNAPEVKVAAVTRQNLVQTVVAPGSLEATDVQEIRAPFTTTRVHMLVGLGDQVTAGQPLAELDTGAQEATVANLTAQVAQAQAALSQLSEQQQLAPIAAQQQLEQARALVLQAEEEMRKATEAAQQVSEGEDEPAMVKIARANLESARKALEAAELKAKQTGALTDQIQAARAQLDAAQAALRLAQSKLDQAVVVAPVDGIVLSVALEDGQPATEGTLLCTIGSLDTLTLKARVDEVDIAKIQPGQKVTIKTNAYLNERFEGTVTRVAAQTIQPMAFAQGAAVAAGGSGSSTTPYYEVQAVVENPEGKLKGGMTAEATFETASQSDALVVELGSLREDENGTFVLVVRDNRVELRPVTVGLRTQTHAEIVDGLTEGERIVSGPFNLVQSLSDGDWVRIEAGSAEEDGK